MLAGEWRLYCTCHQEDVLGQQENLLPFSSVGLFFLYYVGEKTSLENKRKKAGKGISLGRQRL